MTYVFVGSNPALPTNTILEIGVIEMLKIRMNSYPLLFEALILKCGSSSVDRALAFQAKGREFESRLPLRIEIVADVAQG